jgi:hypothetical protein
VKTKKPKFRPVLEVSGTLLSWDEFVDDVRNGMLEDFDGFGELATETDVSDIAVSPSDLKFFGRPEWASHVMWFNT